MIAAASGRRLPGALRFFGRAVAAVFSGVLLYASYQPTGLWWAAPVGMALFFATVTRRRAALLSWLSGLTLYALLLPWVGEFVGASAWIALAVVQSLYSLAFGLGLKVLLGWAAGRRGGLLVTVPAWFVAVEWVRSHWPFGGFGWGRLAWGQVGGPLAGLIRLGGPAVVTWAVVFIGLAVGWALRPARDGARGHVRPRLVSAGAAVVLSLAAVGYHAAVVRPAADYGGDANHLRVAAVQGNVPRLGLDFNSQRRAVLDNHVRETGALGRQVAAGTAPPPDVVLWPENASDISPFSNSDARAEIEWAVRAVDAPIVLGTVTSDPVPGEPGASADHNVMVAWVPQGDHPAPGERHEKRFLQPFGEYMPLRGLLRHVSSYVDRAGSFVPGTGNGVIHVPTREGRPVALGVATCYEVAFDAAFRDAVRSGAQVLVSPTNNATFGFTDMTYQQLAMSRMRAIEYDRAVVVPATSGVSALVRPDGSVESRSQIFTPAVLQGEVGLRDTRTISARVGPGVEAALATLGGVAVAIAALYTLARRRNGPRKETAGTRSTRRQEGRSHGKN
ncbi:apolipoprotein N-acyltransferase [Corynebacterium heidelbergense]|nr:apolipoprotein N-acyltransferase [Corynebacterium heidelbergense]